MFCEVVLGSTTQTNRRPKYRHACAKPMPMLPELDSITVPPNRIKPSSNALLRILSAVLSLMLPPGLAPSNFAYSRKPIFRRTRVNRIKGVLPIVDRMPSLVHGETRSRVQAGRAAEVRGDTCSWLIVVLAPIDW